MSFLQLSSDDFNIDIRHSLIERSQAMSNFQIPTPAKAFDIDVKDPEGEGDRQVDEPGDNEGVRIFSNFFLHVV